MNVVMLLTDGFGGFGGIAKFNRDFLEALDASEAVNRVEAIPRIISEPIDGIMPESVVYDRKAAGGKTAFVQRAAAHAWLDCRIDLVICAHINLLPVAHYVAKHRRARLVLIIHGIDAWQPTDSTFTNHLTQSIDGFIAVSEFSADKFCQWSGVSRNLSFILHNCVDLDRFIPQARDQALVERYRISEYKVIMTLGRLAAKERYKGFDEVLEVMPELIVRFPNLKYFVVGEGEDSERLKNKAKSLDVEKHTIFTGRIPESKKVAYYSLADAYVMPSSGEGFGIVLIEAAAAGIPVIGSTVDGSREALLNGRMGRLVNPKNPSEIIETITQVLNNNAPHRRPDGIEMFGVTEFRARVDHWARDESKACFPRRNVA